MDVSDDGDRVRLHIDHLFNHEWHTCSEASLINKEPQGGRKNWSCGNRMSALEVGTHTPPPYEEY
eukprot:5999956-Pleurochrysis_carterae.AAC.4